MIRHSSDARATGAPGLPPRSGPLLLLDLDVARPIPPLSLQGRGPELRYVGAQCLVRIHTFPLGIVRIFPASGEMAAWELASAIWCELGPRIAEHLRGDGCAPVSGLSPAGLPPSGTPRCLQARERALVGAPMVSVVIATRDRPDSLALCLRALAGQAYPRFEVVVVDNAPATTGTADLVRERAAELPSLRYVCEREPGTSNARNRGVRMARGEIVACTDDDAVPDPHWLAEVVRGFEAGPRVGCVTGLILPSQLETPAQVWFEQFGGFGRGFEPRLYDLAEHRPPDPLFPFTAGRFGSGPNMSFKRSVLLDIGGFDPALGGGTPSLGGEDLAAYFQTISRGHQLAYQPSAVVFHEHRRDYAALRHQMLGYGLGLTGYLTKCMLDEPRRLPSFLARIPFGALYAMSPRSQKNRHKRRDYPKELSRLEVGGMICGPYVYFRGRRLLRRRARTPSRAV